MNIFSTANYYNQLTRFADLIKRDSKRLQTSLCYYILPCWDSLLRQDENFQKLLDNLILKHCGKDKLFYIKSLKDFKNNNNSQSCAEYQINSKQNS